MGHTKLPIFKVLLSATVAFVFTACSQAPPPAVSAPEPATPAAAAPLVAPAPQAAPAAAAVAAPVVESAPVPAAEPKPVVHKRVAPKPKHHHAAAPVIADSAPEATAAPVREPMTVCTSCGVITTITPVKSDGKGTAIGVVAGGLAGLVIGNQIGGGNGKTIAKVAGAAGGALLGNKIEKRVRAETSYAIKVRLDDGSETTVTQDAEPKLAVGAAVKIVDGVVVGK